MALKILTSRRFALWTQQLLSWLEAKFSAITIDTSDIAKQGTDDTVTLTGVDDKIDDFYDTFDADMALQLSQIIGNDESESEPVSGNSATEGEISNLRTLQESYSALAGNSSAIALETEIEEGKSDIVTAIENKGGVASISMSMSQLASAIGNLAYPTKIQLSALTVYNYADNQIVDLSGIGLFTGTTLYFGYYSSVKQLLHLPPSPNITTLTIYNMSSLEKLDMEGFDFRDLSFYALLSNDTSLTWVNFIGTKASAVDFRNMFLNANLITTLVGDYTYQQVITPTQTNTDGLAIFEGISNILYGNSFLNILNLNQASLRAFINGLADRTGQSTTTIQVGATNLAKLSSDDIAVATRKNWTIAS